MSYQDRVQRLQLVAAQNRLESLEQQYEDLSQQIGYTTNLAHLNQLKKQRDTIAQQMAEEAGQCDQLEQAIANRQQLPAQWQELKLLLEPLPWEVVTQAYQTSFPPEARARSTPNTLPDLVQQLADLPTDEPGQPTPIEHLLMALLRHSALTFPQRQALTSWASAQGLAVVPPQIAHTLEYILMIKVQPRAAGDPSQGCRVSAALVIDSAPGDRAAPCQATPLAGGGTLVQTLAELPELLSEWMACCGSDYSVPLAKLTVHWFLPLELMSWPVEHLPIRTGRNQEVCHGQRCKTVVVRSYDRQFSSDYRTNLGDWQQYWERLYNCNSATRPFLAHLNPYNNSPKTIPWSQPHTLGCAFIEHSQPRTQVDFWDKLLSQGVPLALWVRCLGLSTAARALVRSVVQCSPLDLPIGITRQRSEAFDRTAQAPEAERLRAAPLALLWDNPYRPFPSVDYTST